VLAGSWTAITGVWDAIKQVQEIYKDAGKLFESLGATASELMSWRVLRQRLWNRRSCWPVMRRRCT
jgi:hypothetical protein